MRAALAVLTVVTLAGLACAQPVRRGEVILSVGDTPSWADGQAVDGIETPFTATDGTLGFVGGLTGGTQDARTFVFAVGGPVFFSNEATGGYTLSGRETSMGLTCDGKFLYSPRVTRANGVSGDGLWSNAGLLLAEPDAAPGAPGKYLAFTSGPAMLANGEYSFMAGFSNTPGGTTTDRALYKGNLNTGVFTLMYKTGDLVDGRVLRFATPNVSFRYDFSDNGENVIHIVGVDAGAGTNAVMANGHLVAVQGEALASDPNEGWQNFTGVGVNDSGQQMIFGDFITDIATDAFITVNGNIIVREGDTIAGTALTTPASVRSASINNLGRVGAIWQIGSTANRALFIGDAADFRGTAIKIVQTGDLLDIDGDGVGDRVVSDLVESTVSGPGMDLADDGAVFTSLNLTPIGGGTAVKAIVKFCYDCSTEPACPCCPADFNSDGGVDGPDVEAFFTAWQDGVTCGDVNKDGGIDGGDVEAFFTLWSLGGC